MGYERAVEERIEFAVECVVKQAVADERLVDVAGLGVADFERLIAPVLVCFCRKVAVKCDNIVHQTILELLDIFFLPLATHELPPRREQVFHRDDILVWMSELNQPSRTPPPCGFCPCLSALSRLICSGMNIILNYRRFTNTLSEQR